MPKAARILLLAAPVLTLFCGCASGLPKRYVCQQTPEAIAIDGRPNDAAWALAEWTDDFADIQGTTKPKPRFRTRAKLLWDEEYLYIAAELEDPHVWGTLKNHDDIVFYDNDFEIFIDPNGDTREYYEIEVNVLNTIFDLFLVKTYIDGGPALHDWNMQGLKSATHVNGTLNDPTDTDTGWTVEFALPWRSLKEAAGTPAPPRPGDVWRMNFSRVEWQIRTDRGRYDKVPDTPEDNWVWSPQGVINMHVPATWGYVKFAGPGE